MFSKRNKKDPATPDGTYCPAAGMAAMENCILFGIVDDVFMAQFLAAGLSKSLEQVTPGQLFSRKLDRWGSINNTPINSRTF